MASLAEIRSALAAAIEAAVADLTGYETVPESVNAPAFLVVPRLSNFETVFGRGTDQHIFDVIVLVSRRDDELAQLDLDPYVTGAGSSSIRQALWNDRTLGGVVDEARVTGMTDYGATFPVGLVDFVGARLTVEVMASGTA